MTKKIYSFLLAALCCTAVMAQKEIYGVFDGVDKLTIFYDENRESQGGVLDWWDESDIQSATKTVEFDASIVDARPTSTSHWFSHFNALTTIVNIDKLNTEEVTGMSEMFAHCNKLSSLDVSGFNTEKVTNMQEMFSGCAELKSLDVSGFNTEKVTNMYQMFSGCVNLWSLNLSAWNTENVENMYGMFQSCANLISIGISGWNTSKVKDMMWMFNNCHSITDLDLSGWNTENVTNMYGMFCGCESLNTLNLSGWNTEKVENMHNMFFYCKNLSSLDVSSFDTKNVTEMDGMFEYCEELTSLDVSGFDTKNVTNMSEMFAHCKKLNFSPLEFLHFDTRNVTDMGEMFEECKAATTLDLRSFNVSNVENFNMMFEGCENLTTIICNGDWSSSPSIDNSDDMFDGCTKLVGGGGTAYDEANPKDVTFARIDLNPLTYGYFTGEAELYSVYDTEEKTLTYYYDFERLKHEGIIDLVHHRAHFEEYCDEATKVIIDPTVWDCGLTVMTNLFHDFVGMSLTGLHKVQKIEGLENIRTDIVTNFSNMFYDMQALDTLLLGSFYMENALTVKSMFNGCSSLKHVELSSFSSTKNVIDFSNMFLDCSSLESLDVRSLNTESAENMGYMFAGCTSLKTLDLSYFNTENVKYMYSMFAECTSLETVSLDRFRLMAITHFDGMFKNCWSLKTIWIDDDWSGFGIPDGDMFLGCTSLVGGEGTVFDDDHIKSEYARIDGGSGSEGYFSRRSTDKQMYTIFDVASMTLTFYYDENFYYQPYGHTTTIPELVDDRVFMPDYSGVVKNIVFNSSFDDARPTIGGNLFHQLIRDEEGKVTNTFGTCIASSISGWEYLHTDEMTDMSYLFAYLYNLDLSMLDLTALKTDKVTDMNHMFCDVSATTSIDLSSINTENVTDMSYMFDNCWMVTSLDLSKFKTDKVTNMSGMFNECNGLTSLDLKTFETDQVTDMSAMFRACDGLTSLDIKHFNTENVTDMSHMFEQCNELTSLDVSQLNTGLVRDMSYMFGNCYKLTELDVSALKTDSVRSMQGMFSGCSGLSSLDLSNFVTDSCTNIKLMFQNCANLTSVDLSSFNTAKVKDMSGMFIYCSSLPKVDLSSFNTENVKWMDGMFSSCSSLTKLDLSMFYTPKLADASYMFYECPKLDTINLRSFQAKDIMDMRNMFDGCSHLKYVDISTFGSDKLFDVHYAFISCPQLNTIVCNENWVDNEILISDSESSKTIFAGCYGLSGPLGTLYTDYVTELADDNNHINFARVDQGEYYPGFFTPTFEVKFFDADHLLIKTDTVVYGKAATEPETTPTKEGYHFTGWDMYFKAVYNDLYVNPKFEINTYTVAFVDKNGDPIDEQVIEWNKAATEPVAPDVEGYDFTGWDKAFDHVTEDMTVQAQYTIKTFTVKFFDGKGNIIDTQTVDWGKDAVAPEAPEEEGLHFTGWDKAFTNVKEDITVNALYAINTYKVTLIAEHGSITVEPDETDLDKVEHGTKLTLTAVPDEGYEFVEWVSGDNQLSIVNYQLSITCDTTVTALFKLKTFTVTFLGFEDADLGSQTVDWGKDAVAPEAPEVEGYTFTGWDKTFTNVKEDLTVKALYAINTYKVTLIAEHGSITVEPDETDLDKVEHGTKLTLTAVPEEGYEFVEWTVGDNQLSIVNYLRYNRHRPVQIEDLHRHVRRL